jgi:phosphatidylserine/phosphatidylglycerophosphate/cardiolipin synthase-like enzyme
LDRNQPITDALTAAKRRGVDVQVLLGNQPGFGGTPPPNQKAIDELNAAGIPAQFFTRHYLHGKVVVADNQAFVGSQNFTAGGLLNNRELGEQLSNPEIVKALANMFADDAIHSQP